MANEQQRAQRIQSDFQKLLGELKKQDEQIAELYEATGVDPDDLDDVDVSPELAAKFDEVEPAPRPLPARPNPMLRGVVLRG